MWSSPLLLLVLVFTLTGSSTTPAGHHLESGARAVTTSTRESTTSTVPVTSTTPPPVATTTILKNSSVSVTNSTVKPTGPVPSTNVANGELEGSVSSALREVDIPLQGPGIWTLSTTSPSLNHLECPTSMRGVGNYIALLTSESCQLQIASATTGASLTWLLTPAP